MDSLSWIQLLLLAMTHDNFHSVFGLAAQMFR